MVHSMILRSITYQVLYLIVLFETTFGLYETVPHIIVFMADDLVRF